MISIAICEDCRPVQARIEAIISDFLPELALEVFSSGEELLALIEK